MNTECTDCFRELAEQLAAKEKELIAAKDRILMLETGKYPTIKLLQDELKAANAKVEESERLRDIAVTMHNDLEFRRVETSVQIDDLEFAEFRREALAATTAYDMACDGYLRQLQAANAKVAELERMLPDVGYAAELTAKVESLEGQLSRLEVAVEHHRSFRVEHEKRIHSLEEALRSVQKVVCHFTCTNISRSSWSAKDGSKKTHSVNCATIQQILNLTSGNK